MMIKMIIETQLKTEHCVCRGCYYTRFDIYISEQIVEKQNAYDT